MAEPQRNEQLLKLEVHCAKFFEMKDFQHTGDCKDWLRKIAYALETHSDEPFFHVPPNKRRSRVLEVLALDLAWLSPGPTGIWSKRGRQAYLWCENHCRPAGTRSGQGWYKRALQKYFSGPQARSLLSLPSIYTNTEFAKLEPLGDSPASVPKISGSRITSDRQWDWALDTFDPKTDKRQSSSVWEDRFQFYKKCLREEVASEFGNSFSNSAQLAWVYVSPGTSGRADDPPAWGVSLFLLFRFLSKATSDREQGLLISNIYHSLKSASESTLEKERGIENIAKSLSHEFKNLNQDLTTLAGNVRAQLQALPQIHSPQQYGKFIASLRPSADALCFAAQATTAFTSACFWLFSPKNGEIQADSDPQCRSFKHICSLALHLLAHLNPNWQLIGIPSLNKTVSFLRKDFDIKYASAPEELLKDLPLKVMLLFAIEPVRNMRAANHEDAETPIAIRLHTSGRILSLQRTTYENKSSNGPVRSKTIADLMKAVAAFLPRPKLVYVEPDVHTKSFKTKQSNRFRVERTTRIHVYGKLRQVL